MDATFPADPRATETFEKVFGCAPQWGARVPGRVNVIGEHIDYNDGTVLPAAINRYLTVLAAPSEGSDELLVKSDLFPEGARLNLADIPSAQDLEPRWMRYVLGVVAGYQRLGVYVPGMQVWVESTIPVGSGLSSSAALEVAFATLFESASGKSLAPKQKALLCQRAEQEFAGVPCGIMDQFACVLSQKDHFLDIDCRTLEVAHIPFSDPGVTLLIANTGVSHDLATSEYAKRKRDCELALRRLGRTSWRAVTADILASASGLLEESLYRRARHVVTEIERAQTAVDAVRERSWEELGELMDASHQSLAEDYEVSCAELDHMVATGREIGLAGGVYGGRMTGGGFGGSTVWLIRTEAAETIMNRMDEGFEKRTGHVAELFVTRPMRGAQTLTFPETTAS